MNTERAKLFAELLTELAEDDLFVPQEAWDAWQIVAPHAYNEIVIPRFVGRELQFLLTRRGEGDPEFPGRPWHIPGSRWKPWRKDPVTKERIPMSQADACVAAARSEGLGEVKFLQEIGTHYWDTFSYRYLISHICLCDSLDKIEESEEMRFFALDDLPNNIIKPHDEFLVRTRMAIQKHLKNL